MHVEPNKISDIDLETSDLSTFVSMQSRYSYAMIFAHSRIIQSSGISVFLLQHHVVYMSTILLESLINQGTILRVN